MLQASRSFFTQFSLWGSGREFTPTMNLSARLLLEKNFLKKNIWKHWQDDPDVKSLGDRWGMDVKRVKDLPIPSHMIPPPLLAAAIEAEEQAAEQAIATEKTKRAHRKS
jgi:hypothetical protein